jgi:hypothetical protein
MSRVGAVLLLAATACGGSASVPGVNIALVADDTHPSARVPGVNIALVADDTHPCAGAVRLKATLSEVNGDAIERELDAAVPPEQLDCDFSNGVAEAVWADALGEIPTGKPYLAKVELFDSTGLSVAAGGTEVFQAHADEAGDPVTLQLTRLVPVGTLLVDLYAEPTSHAAGTLTVELLAGSEVLGTRDTSWPGDESIKRPLRISGLPELSGLKCRLTVSAGGSTIASFVTDSFGVGSSAQDAFASPNFEPN